MKWFDRGAETSRRRMFLSKKGGSHWRTVENMGGTTDRQKPLGGGFLCQKEAEGRKRNAFNKAADRR